MIKKYKVSYVMCALCIVILALTSCADTTEPLESKLPENMKETPPPEISDTTLLEQNSSSLLDGVWQLDESEWPDAQGFYWVFSDEGICEIYTSTWDKISPGTPYFSSISYSYDEQTNVLALSSPAVIVNGYPNWSVDYSSFQIDIIQFDVDSILLPEGVEVDSDSLTPINFYKCENSAIETLFRVDGWSFAGGDGTYTATTDSGEIVTQDDLIGTWMLVEYEEWLASADQYVSTDDVNLLEFTADFLEISSGEWCSYHYFPDWGYVIINYILNTEPLMRLHWYSDSILFASEGREFTSEELDEYEGEIKSYIDEHGREEIPSNYANFNRDNYLSILTPAGMTFYEPDFVLIKVE